MALPKSVVLGLWTVLLAVLLVVAPTRSAAAEPTNIPTGWPLTGPGPVLAPFDPPATPWGKGHRGVDVGARAGANVLATGSGRVTFAGIVAGRGVVVVDHGSLRTTYEPVSASVPVGTRVSAGTSIGHLVAESHCGATSCLHWGLRRGSTYLDPLGAGRDGPFNGNARVRLLPASARAVAEHAAATRAAAARAELATRLAGQVAGVPTLGSRSSPNGRHGFLRPVAGAITSAFGRRFHPVRHVWKLHDGTDLGAGCGTAIRAPYAGVVTRAYSHPAYGQRLFLDHGRVDGRQVVTSYNHATRYVVGPGSRVGRGQVIGFVGASGSATGCHLHLMVWLDGRLANPTSWL